MIIPDYFIRNRPKPDDLRAKKTARPARLHRHNVRTPGSLPVSFYRLPHSRLPFTALSFRLPPYRLYKKNTHPVKATATTISQSTALKPGIAPKPEKSIAARLEEESACVCVPPPLSANGFNPGSPLTLVPCMIQRPSSTTFQPSSWNTAELEQSPPEELSAIIEPDKCTLPWSRFSMPPPNPEAFPAIVVLLIFADAYHVLAIPPP